MRRYAGLIAASAAGLLVMVGCVFLQGASPQSASEWMLVLSNAALVPGVAMTGIGALAAISGEGIFDAMKYTFSAIWTHLRGGKLKYDSYYAYTKREHKPKQSMGFLIIPGVVLLAIALAFAGIFYIV